MKKNKRKLIWKELNIVSYHMTFLHPGEQDEFVLFQDHVSH